MQSKNKKNKRTKEIKYMCKYPNKDERNKKNSDNFLPKEKKLSIYIHTIMLWIN